MKYLTADICIYISICVIFNQLELNKVMKQKLVFITVNNACMCCVWVPSVSADLSMTPSLTHIDMSTLHTILNWLLVKS